MRLLLALAYVLVLAIVSLEIPLALSLRDRVDSEVRLQARSEADVVAARAAALLGPRDRAQLQRLAKSASGSARGRVIVVDAGGRVLADSAGPGALGDGYGGRPEIAAALKGRSVQRARHSSSLDADILATAVPVVSGGTPAGAVRITQSQAAVGRSVRRAIAGLALVGGVVLLLGLGAGILIARQVARPLRRLDDTARRIAGGDLENRALVEGSSEQRSLARSFNEMTDRLARALQSQKEFVADASHQLRTPLTGLRLRLEEARAARSQGEVERELGEATREVDRMAEMVEELLVLSRAGERELPGERVDLTDVVHRAVDRWRPAADESGIELRVSGPSGDTTVWSAKRDLDRALDVLIENAINYSHTGTEVEVAARGRSVEVLDRGPGLEAVEERQVFERFHRGQAGRAGPAGTGLGLPIARELAGEWGGTAELENRPGGGACARLAFPPSDGFAGPLPDGD